MNQLPMCVYCLVDARDAPIFGYLRTRAGFTTGGHQFCPAVPVEVDEKRWPLSLANHFRPLRGNRPRHRPSSGIHHQKGQVNGVDTSAISGKGRRDQQVLARAAIEIADPYIGPPDTAVYSNRSRPWLAVVVLALDVNFLVFGDRLGDDKIRRRASVGIGPEMTDLAEVTHTCEGSVLTKRKFRSEQHRHRDDALI